MDLPKLNDIEEAKSLISKYIHATPVLQSSSLNELVGSTNYLKAEIFQKTGSFKARGALNKILHLSEQQKANGIIAVSLGNHAQAVAWAARILGGGATIFMPTSASPTKIAATKGYGANIILNGFSPVETFAEFENFQRQKKMTLIHPFNDFYVIAGAGTIAFEIFEQVNNIDNILVPVGGGGLLAGMAIAAKSISPKTKIIGIEPSGANSVFQSWKNNKICHLDSVCTIADVLALPSTGELNLAAINEFVDDIICLNDDEIKTAIRFLFERCKLVVEPGGAIGLAALLSGKFQTSSSAKNVIILSGGNVDLRFLSTL
jgi:threonine dehydratase